MRNCALILLLMLLCALSVWAASPRLSVTSRAALAHQVSRAGRLAPASGSRDSYQAFVSVDDSLVIGSLRRNGVKVNALFDGFAVVTIPADALMDVATLSGVRQVSLARQLHLCNDSARYLSNVDILHTSTSHVVPLMGEGVIVGMIDVGIDYNHINLCDSNGRSRVRAVYMPMDDTGVAPVVRGDTLPGSCYETPEQIALLTTDYASSSHGTHTTGTAAGSYRQNGYHGVAPEADIVVCGIPSPELTDANIANGVSYIFDYADRVGKPCVINMSLGSNGGPNDGSSFLCRAFESLTGPGRICVVSAGNDGNVPICIHHAIAGEGDTLTTLLRNAWGGLQRQGFVSMWSDGLQQHRSRLVIINRASGDLEYASPFLGFLPEDSVYTISSDNDPDFARYYTGEVIFATGLEPGYDASGLFEPEHRYLSYWLLDATSNQAGHLLGMQYVADEQVNLAGWTDRNCYFYTFGLPGVTGGDSAGSISDLATTDSVISVGAYCSRASYVDRSGNTVNISGCHPGDIASFSSFGPDEQGVARPDICAPGMALLSSASRYDTVAGRDRWPAPVMLDAEEFPYYSNQGTSMSSPVVAGTVALMLQVNPALGPSAVRELLQRTSVVDPFVANDGYGRWGSGKLDAAAAVDAVIGDTFLPGDVNNDGEVGVADVMALIDIILADKAGCDTLTLLRADVNHDCEVLLADLNALIDLILKD